MSYKTPLYYKVKEYCEAYLERNLPARMFYHNVQHTKDVVSAAEEIGLGEKLEPEEMEVLLIAAWFHDTGYCIKYLGHEDESMRLASEFLVENGFPAVKIASVLSCINATRYKHEPESNLEACMIDADRLGMGKANFTESGERLRAEWEEWLGKQHSEKDWLEVQASYLNETHFFTHYADKHYTVLKEKNVAKIKKLKEVLEEKNGFTQRLGKKTLKRSKKVIKYVLQSAALGMVISFTLNFSFWNIDEHLVIISVLAGVFIGIVLRIYEKQYTQTLEAHSTFAVSLAARTLAMGGLFLMSIVVSTVMYAVLLSKEEYNRLYTKKIEFIFSTPENIFRFIILTLLISFLLNFIRLTSRILGPRVLTNYVLGRYFRPRAEERLFMFIDLNSSTTYAEMLGPHKYHQLLVNFFNDISPAITRTKGEIYQYVGDEVVITWDIKDGIKKNNCIRCYFEMEDILSQLRNRYEAEFGIRPEFKAGIHGGRVITAIVGKLKSDIVFHGDVVNTSERILNQCHPLHKKILVSEFVVRRLKLYPYYEAEFVSTIKLKGKERDMSLYTILEVEPEPGQAADTTGIQSTPPQ